MLVDIKKTFSVKTCGKAYLRGKRDMKTTISFQFQSYRNYRHIQFQICAQPSVRARLPQPISDQMWRLLNTFPGYRKRNRMRYQIFRFNLHSGVRSGFWRIRRALGGGALDVGTFRLSISINSLKNKSWRLGGIADGSGSAMRGKWGG